MLARETVLALTPTAKFQALGENEGAVVMMVDSGQLYTCNDTTVALLQAVDGSSNFGSIVDLIHGEFEVEREVLAADLEEIITELQREGILTILPSDQ